MKLQQKLRKNLKRLTLISSTLLVSAGTPFVQGMTGTALAIPVTAKSADDFVDSMCVNTHWDYENTPYKSNYDGVKQKLLELGVRHVRDGGSSSNAIARMKDLASVGIKTTYIMNPANGVAPNNSYWVSSPAYYINDFVKNKVGTNAIDAVEISNEIDLTYSNFYWHPGDTERVNNDPTSPLYWIPYVRSLTKDTWNALKNDPITAGTKVIGPSLGRTYSYSNKSPLGDLSTVVDWGNMHSYPFGGNSFNNPYSYATIAKYYWHGNFPSLNIDENPYIFDVYGSPFGTKPMASTETGYSTTSLARGISEKAHGRYMPRLFLEYFRKGIPRTCSYEFVNQHNNPNDAEANFGLIRDNLSEKPAYKALKNLISVLKEPGANFVPGVLDYSFTVTPVAGYNKTKFVHSLLLQKSNKKFYLAIWHEISSGDISTTPTREIDPPGMPTKITFNTPLSSAVTYVIDDAGAMDLVGTAITDNTISLNVRERVKIIELTPR
jgi:hypothetical protein